VITHRERMQACLRGEILDRPPVALWRHFPVDDQNPETLADAHLAFQNLYDFDVLKVTPASSYSVKDWGVEDLWEGDSEGTRRYSKYVISRPSDWQQLRELEPDVPHLAAHLDCLRRIRRGLGPDTPLLLTVFNALSQAKHLAGNAMLLAHLRESPAALEEGLRTITASTRRFVQAAADAGIDGIFLAVQHAQPDILAPDEFLRWSRPSDLALLDSAKDLWCNMLHLHGESVNFDATADYPVQVMNWHDRETPPTLSEARGRFRGVLCGGLARQTLTLGTPDKIRIEAREAMTQVQGRRFVLSTGCVIPVISPHGNIMAARHGVDVGSGSDI